MELKRLHEVSHSKYLKGLGRIVEVRIRHDDFVIEMNCRTNEFCQEGNDSL